MEMQPDAAHFMFLLVFAPQACTWLSVYLACTTTLVFRSSAILPSFT